VNTPSAKHENVGVLTDQRAGKAMQARPWEDNHLVSETRAPAARKHSVGPASGRRVSAITTSAETTSYQRRPWLGGTWARRIRTATER
jgi:hypothetical protein